MSQEMTVDGNFAMERATADRILVALDASPHSTAALRAAAYVAAAMQVALHGVFVEDDRLLRLCNAPFGHEVGLLTAKARPLDSSSVERKLRVMATELRSKLAHIAAEVQVQWTFQVRRGGVERELLNEAENALLLSLGRTNWLARRGLGSTAQYLVRELHRPLLLLGQREDIHGPLTLVYNDSASAERALQLAVRLVQHSHQPLTMLLVTESTNSDAIQRRVATELQSLSTPVQVVLVDSTAHLQAAIQNAAETLILPIAHVDLLTEIEFPVLLVP